MSNSDSWCTPPEVCDPLAEFFGGPVDVDPCSNRRSIVQAVLALTRGGLVLPWRLPGKRRCTGYMNEPYSKATGWTEKALAELASGNIGELIRLTMMSTSTKWWADMCNLPRYNPRILALRRLKFLDPWADDPRKKRQGCRFEPGLIYIGPRPDRFTRIFKHLTSWATWGRENTRRARG